ncbi:hypothetical protein Ahy_B07g087498 isoform C [Arachis hypogaea]|uniref:Uncharacterized protein n=1 Tax=Arachis hypogaea TaxID=3818 RepID=A0A444YCB7_ARAHY|nr:hypothetical protein Ahy_B07g087498 isoform C [Arachis hypogaea]
MEGENPNDVLIKINAILKEAQPLLTDECCIYRVPHEIRKFKEDAYTPKVVSIGPFHHGDPKLLKMEGLKRTCCREFIERSEKKNLKSFVSCVQELEAKVRGCYSDEIKLSEEEHVMVINNDELTLVDVGRIAHFTDLTRKSLLRSSHLLQPSTSGCSREAKLTQLYSATELNEAGVKFEVHKTSQCLLDLELSGHTLKIPFIRVMDSTEVILRNLLAFEQCHYIHESYLTDYAAVFDFLINTEKDVDFFVKNGIIENWIGDSNAVAEMFNGLGVNVVHPNINTQYLRICEELNAFCNHPWNRKVATLRRDYCNTPWKTVASIAGIFLLILTIIQTVFSILQVILA